jgi:flagellar biosynthetic protein FlhB
VIVLGAGLAGFVQVGPLFATAAFTPDLRRLDPVTRLVSMFSFDRLREVAWTIAKLVVLLAVGGAVPLSGLRGLLGVASGSAANASGTLIVMLEAVALRIALAAVLVGAVDLVLRHLRHRRAMRMSRRELVQEQRENYGVPEHRERRRRLASEAAVAAALADLDTASVLLLDGRGRALALAFDPHDQAQRAPRVVAKAHGAAVARLWAKAEQCGIGVRMQPSLVAALFPLELTEAVPHAHYAAVAEVWRELVTRPTSTP